MGISVCSEMLPLRHDGSPPVLATRTSTWLLASLHDPANAPAWEAFDARYRPILFGFARRLGFAGEDAAELAQQTLAEFARAYRLGRYQRDRGRLSSWLIGIASHVGSNMRRRARAGGGAGAGSANPQAMGERAAELPDEAHLTEVWDAERKRAIMARALDELRHSSRTEENTLRAFELFAIHGVPAIEVAAQCALSVDAVYGIKNRLTVRLRESVARLAEVYDDI